MATVAVGTKFRDELTAHIETLRIKDTQQQVGPVENQFTADDSTRTWAIARLWGEHYPLHDQMPADWVTNTDSLNISVQDEECGNHAFRLLFPVTPIKVPPRMGTWDITSRLRMNRETIAILARTYEPFNRMLVEHDKVRAVMQLTKKWVETRKSVLDFFNAFPSVNAALKHTPSMQLFVPNAVMERVNSKTARSKADIEAPSIDAEALAAQVVGIHLRNATGA